MSPRLRSAKIARKQDQSLVPARTHPLNDEKAVQQHFGRRFDEKVMPQR